MTLLIACLLAKCKFHILESDSYGSPFPNSTTPSLLFGLAYGGTQSLSCRLPTPIAETN